MFRERKPLPETRIVYVLPILLLNMKNYAQILWNKVCIL